jgi:hypothetical protein
MRYEIKLEPYVEGLLWAPTATARLNHQDCPQGEDTRQRLYIKAVEPAGSWVGHCFNCSGSGVSFTNGFRSMQELLLPCSDDDEVDYTPSGGVVRANTFDGVVDVTEIGNKAWLYKHWVFEEDWPKVPVVEWRSNLLFPFTKNRWQLRWIQSVDGKKGGSKYGNFHIAGAETESWYGKHLAGAAVENSTLILTEDIISAYRVHRDLEVCSVALLGTHVPHTSGFADILREHKHIYVWLDGDLTGMRKSIDVFKELSSTCPSLSIVRADKSPKEYSPTELKEAFIRGR